MRSREQSACNRNPCSVVTCYLGSLPSPGWKVTSTLFLFALAVVQFLFVLFCFEPFHRRIPCRHGFIQVCLGQKEGGEGECSQRCVRTAWHLVMICLLDTFVNGFCEGLEQDWRPLMFKV